MGYPWHPVVHDLTMRLVRLPSVTNSHDEVEFAEHLHELLAADPYFTTHTGDVWLEQIAADPRRRANVYALARGSGRKTVILCGHYDVVDVANFGALAPLAFNPELLLPQLVAELSRSASSPTDTLALHDLKSGDFLPGRGALDMKSGLAAGIAVLLRFAEQAGGAVGNILLIATPDEEDTSQGMRAVTQRLPVIAQERDLELIAAINMDVTVDAGNGQHGQAIFLGSVGKMLPSVYIVGRETHAGAPFDGVNPNLLAAEITRRIECNVDLSDTAHGEIAPPPVTLTQIDLKQRYDVTTPAAAWCAYNVLTHQRSATDVLEMMLGVVREALDSTLEQLRRQAVRFAAMTGHAYGIPEWQPRVLTFAELKDCALADSGMDAQAALARLMADLTNDPGVDVPRFSRSVTELLWSHSGLHGPAAVIGLASLYYPTISLDTSRPRHIQLRNVVTRQAAAFSRDRSLPVRLRSFFPGISDMSFLGCSESAEDLMVMAANTPAWGTRIHHEYHAIQALDLPVINVGPWGRDYHQRTERVYMPYAFSGVPELIWRIVDDLFS